VIVQHLAPVRPTRTTPPAPSREAASDAELVVMARHDPQAFAVLYARYLDPVHRSCTLRLGSREAAEDATSLIFAKVLA
jgi:DNA-directed RNA polymerase specialized sigma24 family protein